MLRTDAAAAAAAARGDEGLGLAVGPDEAPAAPTPDVFLRLAALPDQHPQLRPRRPSVHGPRHPRPAPPHAFLAIAALRAARIDQEADAARRHGPALHLAARAHLDRGLDGEDLPRGAWRGRVIVSSLTPP
jgi:hypothetical protein